MNPPGPAIQTAFSKLQGLVRERAPEERCELCSARLATGHQHLLESASRRLLCSCDACAILFSESNGGKYLRVPRRVLYLSEFRLNDLQWEVLSLPINLAFFVASGLSDQVSAFYPSPAGATESLLALESWRELVELNPILRALKSDVEALLVNRLGETREHFLVPIDECYKLVGLIRLRWRGLSGGSELWKAIEEHFSDLRGRSSSPREDSHA
jgi:hypothetical protein